MKNNTQRMQYKLKLFFFTFIISLIIIPEDLFAHGWSKTRNETCSGFDIEPWMFRARARVVRFGWPTQQTRRDCPASFGGTGIGVAFASASNSCAWQTVRNEWGASTLRGRVTKNRRLCSRGTVYSNLYYDISKYLKFEDEEEFEESEIYSSKVIFNNNSIRIDTLKGSFIQNGNNLISSYELVMWLPNNETDSIINDENTFYSGKIELTNGEVNTYGDFEGLNYQIINHLNGEIEVIFDDVIDVQLPDSINGHSTLIEVSGTSHGDEDEDSDISDFLNQSNDFFEVLISPNPTSGNISISIESFDNINKTYSVQVYDNTMLKVYDGNIEGQVFTTMDLNLNDLNVSTGFVYILISHGNEAVLRKVIYQ